MSVQDVFEEKMKGQKLSSVELSPDKTKITFRFQNGLEQSFGVEGDCCSSSWIEHLELPGNLDGATLTGIDDSDSVDKTDDDAFNPMQGSDDYRYRAHECLMVYHTKFMTDRGDIVLEYRNSSNGYYGGYLIVVS